MKTSTVILAAIIVLVSAMQAHAASPDIRKSDFIVTAYTKDSSATISISVEWESNISITSQAKSNVRASTEMAVLEEAKKYTIDELKRNTSTMKDEIKAVLQTNVADSNIKIRDVAITKIVSKETLEENKIECQPRIEYITKVSWWTFVLTGIALFAGLILGKVIFGKSNDSETDD